MKSLLWLGLSAALLATVGFSLLLGKYPLCVQDVLAFAGQPLGWTHLSHEKTALLENVFLNIRLPRILAALLIGASLAVAGTALQAMFINPLVSPKMLGMLAGSAFGAVLGMLLAKHWYAVQILAVVFGFIAVGFAIFVSRIYQGDALIMLVLGGIISETLFTALLFVAQFVADPTTQLPLIVYWLMGNLGMVDRKTLLLVAGPMLAGIGALLFYGKHLNVLSLGDEEARALGLNVRLIRYGLLFFATLISALSVMLAGMIGWVGLIIPHMARLLVGPNNVRLLPASALMGAIYLILMDDVSRLLFSFEVPIGIVTSLIGIPVFILILKNAKKGWG
jgi:iron complex transport system permease protein